MYKVLIFISVLLILSPLSIVLAEDDMIKSYDYMVLVEAGEKAGITITDDFYISKYSVTIGEYEELTGFNPSVLSSILEDNDDEYEYYYNHPIENVTWYDAVYYANLISEAEGFEPYYELSQIEIVTDPETEVESIVNAKVYMNEEANGYRLPYVEEHIYAAAGGIEGEPTIFPGSNDPNQVAWQMFNVDDDLTRPVGEKQPNELGLYDMAGNVFDWTNTVDGNRRFVRGGAFLVYLDMIETDHTGVSYNSEHTSFLNGFRLARNSK